MNQPSAGTRGGHEIYVGDSLGLPVALVVGKEECTIFEDWAAYRSAKLVALEWRFGGTGTFKVVLGIQSAVPYKFINAAMKLIGAGAGDGVDHTAGSFSIFRGVVTGQN